MKRNPRDVGIIALDASSFEATRSIIDVCLPYFSTYKIGLEFATAVGVPQAVHFVRCNGGEVFLDTKFHDIENTCIKTAHVISYLPIKMFTVHAKVGIKTMKKMVAVVAESFHKPKIIAVTELTSFEDFDIRLAGGGKYRLSSVGSLAGQALMARVDGVVCAPADLVFLRGSKTFQGSTMQFIVPGIRPLWAPHNDQKNVLTPKEALKAGADFLIFGRPVTQPPSGLTKGEAVRMIFEEIKGVLG